MKKNVKEKQISGIQIVRGISGITILQLVIALIVLAVLITIATKIYISYISMAEVTVARSVLDDAGKTLFDYQMANGSYPANIDFTGCTDEKGQKVFPSSLCDRIRKELYSVENYSTADSSYALKVRAKDSKHTLLILSENKITTQGN